MEYILEHFKNPYMWITILLGSNIIMATIVYTITKRIYIIKYKLHPLIGLSWIEGTFDENKAITYLTNQITILEIENQDLKKEGRKQSLIMMVLYVVLILSNKKSKRIIKLDDLPK